MQLSSKDYNEFLKHTKCPVCDRKLDSGTIGFKSAIFFCFECVYGGLSYINIFDKNNEAILDVISFTYDIEINSSINKDSSVDIVISNTYPINQYLFVFSVGKKRIMEKHLYSEQEAFEEFDKLIKNIHKYISLL